MRPRSAASLAVLGKLDDLPKADMVLVLGADVTPELPPLGWKLHEAKEKDGFKLVVANNRKTKFDRYATLSLRYKPGTERILIAGLIKAFLAANPDWTPAVTATGLDELKEAVKKFTAKEVAAKTGVDEAQLNEAVALLAQAKAPAIIFGTELLRPRTRASRTPWPWPTSSCWWANPALPAAPFTRWPRRTTPGASAKWASCRDRLPGYLPLNADNAASFFGKNPVAEPGPNLEEVLDLLEKGDAAAPQALYLLGGDLLRCLPHRSRVEKLLKKVPFIVVQDAFLTDTAKLAQVVLPVAVHAEQEGTFISSTGQLGLLNQALATNGVRPDWQIISQLGAKMGFALKYGNPQGHLPGTGPEDAPVGRVGPQAQRPLPGFQAGAERRSSCPSRRTSACPGRRPFALVVGKSLQHSGSFTTHHPCGTLSVTPGAKLKINPEDAAGLGLAEGDTAKVISSQGEVSVPGHPGPGPAGRVWCSCRNISPPRRPTI